MSAEEIVPPRMYLRVWLALLALLALTTGLAYIPMGWFNTFTSVTIAFAKAVIIVLFFMHVKYKAPLARVFACAGLLWLAILFTLAFGDYFTRSWLPQPTVWLR
jgi:cytochrome c oxidase subunit IV